MVKYSQNQKLFVFIGYIVGYIGLQIALLTAYTVYKSMNGVSMTPQELLIPGIYVTLIASIVTMIGLVFFTKEQFFTDFKQFFKMKRGWVIVFGGVGLMFAVNILLNSIYASMGITGSSENQVLLEQLIMSNPLAMALPVALFIPVIEEILFRGVILEFFEKRWGTIAGVISSSLLFGFMHVSDPASMVFLPVYFFLGSVLAFVYLKSNKNIAVSTLVHIVNNTISVISVLILNGGL